MRIIKEIRKNILRRKNLNVACVQATRTLEGILSVGQERLIIFFFNNNLSFNVKFEHYCTYGH